MSKYVSILNKINNKTILMRNIFPLILNRPTILIHLISDDNKLKSQLNNIFSGIKKKKNNLEKELINNLSIYSYLRRIVYELNKWYFKINEYIVNEKLFNNKDFFLGTNLNNKLNKYVENSIYIKTLNNILLKKIVLDFLSSLDDIPIFYNYIIMNEDYFKYIEDNSKINKKKINLVLLIDEKKFSNNSIPETLKVNKIEVIKKGNKSYDDLFLYINQFLYNKENIIKNVNKIFFHNEVYTNYFEDNNIKNVSKEKYQCLLSFLIDRYYLKENEYTKCLFNVFQNLKEIKIEFLEYLYIYEQFKIYYFIKDFFPYLSLINNENIKYKKDKNFDISICIINTLLIINIKIKQFKIKEFIHFINLYLNNKITIEYLFIFINGHIIKEENENNNEQKNIETNINISNLKEFMLINQSSLSEDNDIEFIRSIIISKGENNIYEGYNKNNKLIFYREGQTHIQSFDLIDLFKYNKKLVHIKLIKEKIIINYNLSRNNLEIKNNGETKNNENNINSFPICHFTQFIYNQNNLNELKIYNFDYRIGDLSNKNINLLNINYEKNESTLEYSIINDQSIFNMNKLLPHLSTINIGGDYKWISYISYNNFSKSLKEINIITENNSFEEIENIKKKLSKFGIKISFDYINKIKTEKIKEKNESNFDDVEKNKVNNINNNNDNKKKNY